MALLDKIKSWVRREPNWQLLSREDDVETRSASYSIANNGLANARTTTYYSGASNMTWGIPQWDTDEAIQRGYECAVAVYRAVFVISQSVASIPLRAEELQADGSWEPQPESLLQQLLNKPNLDWPYSEFAERSTQHLMLGGNSLIRKVVSDDASRGVLELWLVGPGGIRLTLNDADERIATYRWQRINPVDARWRVTTYDAEEIIHVQLPNPANPYWGQSPLQAAARTTHGDNVAVDHQIKSFANGGNPSGILQTNSELDDDAYTNWRTIIERDIAGAQNAGRIMLIDGEVKFTSLGVSAKEMDYIQSRKANREDMLAVYGVPGPVAGYLENATLANLEASVDLFWTGTVLPTVNRLVQNLELGLLEHYEGTWRIVPVLDDVPALLRQVKERANVASTLTTAGFPLRGTNRLLRLGYTEDELAETEDTEVGEAEARTSHLKVV